MKRSLGEEQQGRTVGLNMFCIVTMQDPVRKLTTKIDTRELWSPISDISDSARERVHHLLIYDLIC